MWPLHYITIAIGKVILILLLNVVISSLVDYSSHATEIYFTFCKRKVLLVPALAHESCLNFFSYIIDIYNLHSSFIPYLYIASYSYKYLLECLLLQHVLIYSAILKDACIIISLDQIICRIRDSNSNQMQA